MNYLEGVVSPRKFSSNFVHFSNKAVGLFKSQVLSEVAILSTADQFLAAFAGVKLRQKLDQERVFFQISVAKLPQLP